MDFLSLVAKLSLDSKEYEAGLDKAKGVAGKIGGGIATGLKVAGAAVAAATTAVTGFGAASVKTGMSFDSAMSQVAATMGMTTQDMLEQVGEVDLSWGHFSGNLREYAQEMGANTKFSATEAADALNYMALAGYDAQTSMEMLPNVLNLAAAGGMELATASDMVTDTQTAFGISLERTSQMVDEMAKASSTGNTSVQQLGEAFLTVGGLAQELNGGMVTLSDGTTATVDGVQELEIALTAMANAGIKGSEAGTHMRNMITKLSDPTDAGVASLKKMGVSVFDTEGKMRSLSDVFGELSAKMSEMSQEEKIKTISSLFNSRDLASSEALLNAVNQDWDKIGESILDAEGAASKMAGAQLDNLAGDVTLLKSAFEGAQIAVSDKLTPSLRQFTQLGTQALSDFAETVNKGGLTAGIESIGKSLSSGITEVTKVLPDAINAGVQLMGAIGQGLAQNAPDIGNAILTAAGDLTATGVSLMQKIADGMATFDFATTARNIGQWLSDAISSDTGEGFIGAALSIIGSLVRGIGESVAELAPIGAEIIANVVTSILDNIDGAVDGGIALIEGITEGMLSTQEKLIQVIPQIIVKLVSAIIRNAPKILAAIAKITAMNVTHIVTMIPLFVGAVRQIFVGVIGVIGQYLGQILAQVISGGAQIISNVISFLSQLPTNFAYWMGYAITRFVEELKQLPTKAKEWFDNTMDKAREFFTNLKEESPKKAKEMVDNFVKKMKELPAKMTSIGKDVIEYLKKGISNAWGGFIKWLGDKIVGIAKAFTSGSEKGKSDSKSGAKNSTRSVNSTDFRDTIEAVGQIQNAVKFNENDYQLSHGLKSENSKIDYDELANTIVRAFEKADFGVEVDGREFGRMVRRAVTT